MSDVIARLRELQAAATTGNWLADYSEIVADDGTLVARRMFESDAELVAATINALPLLLDVCEAARVWRDAVTVHQESWRGSTAAGLESSTARVLDAQRAVFAALARLESTDA